jgi:hypothetical protein
MATPEKSDFVKQLDEYNRRRKERKKLEKLLLTGEAYVITKKSGEQVIRTHDRSSDDLTYSDVTITAPSGGVADTTTPPSSPQPSTPRTTVETIRPGEGVYFEITDEGVSKDVLVKRGEAFKRTGWEVDEESRKKLFPRRTKTVMTMPKKPDVKFQEPEPWHKTVYEETKAVASDVIKRLDTKPTLVNPKTGKPIPVVRGEIIPLGAGGGMALTGAAKRAHTFLTTTKTGTFLKGWYGAEIGARVTGKAVKGTGSLTASKEYRELVKTPEFTESIRRGYEAERRAVEKQPWYKQVAYDIPVVSLFTGDQEQYIKTVSARAKRLGFEGKALRDYVKAAQRERTTRGVQEGAELLSIGVASERTGRALITKRFEALKKQGTRVAKSDIGGRMFKEGFKAIAPAGIIEGAVQERSQQRIRMRERNLKDVILMGGFGGASAGVLDGAIVGLRPRRKVASHALEWGANILDPFEKPSDVLADVTEYGQRRLLRQPTKAPTITAVADAFAFGTKTTKPTTTPTKTTKPTTTPTKTRAGVSPLVPTAVHPRVNSFVNTFARTQQVMAQPFPVVPTSQVPVDIPDSIITDGGSPTISSNINVNVPSVTPVNVPNIIPTVTPVAKIPLPLMPGMNLGFGGGGAIKGKEGKRYVDELAAGRQLLQSMTFGNIMRPLKDVMKQPKQNKFTKSKKSKQPKGFFDEGFNPLSNLMGF